MESNGPAIAREALGPLRRLLTGRDRPRPPIKNKILLYATPLGLLALVGLGIATGVFLRASRDLPPWLCALLAVGTVLPVAVAFRRPLLAWRVAYPMMFLGALQLGPREDWPWSPVQILAILVVSVALAVTEEPGVIGWATALNLAPVFLLAPIANAWGSAVLLVAIALFGDLLARRRRSRSLLAEQSELSERERARRAVLEERARIVREMHDVVAHHMSMIAVQAETAPFRVSDLPPSAQSEFATIAGAARAALGDMRRLLGVLRAEETVAERAPQPGLEDVPALVDTASRAGVPVSLSLPALAGVPAAVGLTAYRIVQEALANAARHAPGGPVRVDGRGFADRLELSVRNELTRPVPADGTGHGLMGMRERATLLGGTLEAGPGDGEYLVTAVLPFGEEQS